MFNSFQGWVLVKYGVLCWPRNIIVSCLREVVCPHVKCGAGPGWQDSLIYVLCVLESWYLVTQTLSSGAPLLLLIQRLRPFYSLLPSWHWHQLERTWRVFKSTEYKVEIDQPYNTSYTAKLLKWGLSLNFWFVCHCKKLSFYCYWFNNKKNNWMQTLIHDPIRILKTNNDIDMISSPNLPPPHFKAGLASIYYSCWWLFFTRRSRRKCINHFLYQTFCRINHPIAAKISRWDYTRK